MATLTNDSLVTQFVGAAKVNAFKNWNGMSKQQRGNAIVKAAADALLVCGVPKPTAQVAQLAAGYNGFFEFTSWSLKMSENLFDGFMDYTDINPYFINTLETVYHEARHCEQWWHMARYFALGKKPADIAQGLGIPMNIATLASQRPMKSGRGGGDPMEALTRKWYESVYGRHGGAERGLTLGALALKRTQNASKAVSMDDFRGRIHQDYSGGLPEEQDAWAIQKLVRAKFPAAA